MANYMSLQEIVDLDGALDTERLETIDQIIRALLITRQKTIPGSRSFGLPGIFVDAPTQAAINLLTVDLTEEVSIYAPEVRVDRVEVTEAGEDGTLGLRVYIGGA